MCDSVSLAADEIVQLVGRVGVNEAITNPFGCCDTEEARDEQLWTRGDAASYNLSRLEPSWVLIQVEPRLAESILLTSTLT